MTGTKQHQRMISLSKLRLAQAATLALMLGLGLLVAPLARSQDVKNYKEVNLYTFTGGSDGGSPYGVIRDSKGNLYGITFAGGASNLGTVYKLDKTGKETVLYSFKGSPDGEHPSGSLLMDKAGNLYGANYEGGANGFGSIFKVDASGNESILYSFTSGTDGEYPGGPVIDDASGNLYGTTGYGGASGNGTVFRISPSGKEKILHNFTGKDGQYPFGALLRDSAGNFYGTTSMGGKYGDGTVYTMSAKGKVTVLHHFANGDDGENPYAGVVRDKAGNLYGTTYSGGAGCYGFGCGIVFKVTPKGKETVLHAFGDTDGHYPDFGTLLMDASGNLYGTTYAGGTDDSGTVFEVSSSGTETVLYNFTGGNDEGFPVSGIIQDKAGNLYSTTQGNPPTTYGTVFKLKP